MISHREVGGNVDMVIRDPKHPYTKLLVSSIPWPDPDLVWGGAEDMIQKEPGGIQSDHGVQVRAALSLQDGHLRHEAA